MDLQSIVAEISSLQAAPPAPPTGVSARFLQLNAASVTLRHLASTDALEHKIRKTFESSWSDKSKKAYVSDVFIISQNGALAQAHLAAHKLYAQAVKLRMGATKESDYLTYTYHGTQRTCHVGEDFSKTEPCNKNDCYLCSVMRQSFQLKYIGSGNLFGKGFYSSVNPTKASMYERNRNNNSNRHALLICTVVTGKKERLFKTDSSRTSPGSGFDSIEGVPSSEGGAVLYPETIVFREDAILPHALIMFSDTPVAPPPPSVNVVNGGIYTLTNSLYKTALDMSVNDFRVMGYARHGRDNQQWIFEQQATGGWVIRNKARSDKYLGTKPARARANGTDIAGVPYGERIVWDIQPAVGGTVRVACYDAQSTNIDLSKWGGAANRTKVVMWDHTVNGEHQRWNLVYVGQQGHIQTPFNGGVYSIINSLYKTAMDLSVSDQKVIGYAKHDGTNQEWIFEQVGTGWAIRSKARSDTYLGLRPNNQSNGSELTGVDRHHRIIWVVQAAMNGTVRIARQDSPSMNLDLSKWGGTANGTKIVLWSHTINGEHQRWTLIQRGSQTVMPSGPVQTPVNGKTYTIVNHEYRTGMDLSVTDSKVIGYMQHGGKNQQWIFEQSGSGWVIRSKYDQNKYLGLSPNTRQNGSELVCVDAHSRVTWAVQVAVDGTVRIACQDSQSMNLDLSKWGGAANCTKIILFGHTVDAKNQRWELWPVA